MTSDLSLEDLDYPFDTAHIATRPAEPRDAARMMVVERSGDRVHHARVQDLPTWLQSGDALVVNRTRVRAARLMLRRDGDGRAFEGLLAEPLDHGDWLLLVRGGRRLHPGDHLLVVDPQGQAVTALACVEKTREGWRTRFPAGVDVDAALERAGHVPLPPYIVKARGDHAESEAFDRDRYQTVYAEDRRMHSVAAPTAGLHFTTRLLERLQEMGVERASVTLEVGMGTFKPVESPTLSGHAMHRERCEVPTATLERLRMRRAGAPGRLVAVGTTTVRSLESLPEPLPESTWIAESSLLIQPGHAFRHVDVLMTNFHLPRSTLLALVGAFVGLDRLKRLYALAQAQGYRFFSYGDCMLIL
jgi:S-adenosylmethionine:tRNA ribosyltransferase-isomerase